MTITVATERRAAPHQVRDIIPFGKNPSSNKNTPNSNSGNNNLPPNLPPSGDSGGGNSNFCGKFLSDFAFASDTIRVKNSTLTISKFQKSIVFIRNKFKAYENLISKVKTVNFVKIFNKSELYKKLLNESIACKNELKNELGTQINTINKALKQCRGFLSAAQIANLEKLNDELEDKLNQLDKIVLNYKAALNTKFGVASKSRVENTLTNHYKNKNTTIVKQSTQRPNLDLGQDLVTNLNNFGNALEIGAKVTTIIWGLGSAALSH